MKGPRPNDIPFCSSVSDFAEKFFPSNVAHLPVDMDPPHTLQFSVKKFYRYMFRRGFDQMNESTTTKAQ
jgi:hypothetical protein